MVLEALFTMPEKEEYMNQAMLLQFQGSAYFALELNFSSTEAAGQDLSFLKEDGNGGWKQRKQVLSKMACGGKSMGILTVYYKSTKKANFRKILMFVIKDDHQKMPAADICDVTLIQYYWLSVVEPFTQGCGKTSTTAYTLVRLNLVSN